MFVCDIDYNNFNRVAKHEQSKLNQIQALGLIKNSDGQYVFSLVDWLKRNAQDEESAEGRQLESEVRKQELQTEQESLQKTVRSIRKKTELIKFIGDNEELLGKELGVGIPVETTGPLPPKNSCGAFLNCFTCVGSG